MEKYLIFKLGIAIGLFLAALFVLLYDRIHKKKNKRKKWRYKWRYKWNAVLDKNTCSICSEMHGKIFTKEKLRNTHPPLHGLDENNRGCRCYLTLAK